MTYAKKILAGKSEEKEPSSKWNNTIEVDLTGIRWIHLAQNRVQWL
jgi:hypothetical protein